MWFYRIFLPPTIFNTDSLNICNKDIIKLIIANVRTSFDLDPTQEWIQAHVAQTMNL